MIKAGFLAALLFITYGQAWAAKRVAFVIGVDAYENLPVLQKAVGDARSISATFESAGYQVNRLENPTRETFWTEWLAFLGRIAEGDEVALFYSGHGMEIEGANYLLMRNAPKAQLGERIIRQDAIKFLDLLLEMQARRPRVSLVILDACRNNPYAASGVRSIGGSKGLGVVVPPEGAFVMFSAGANEEALDRLTDSDQEPVSVYMRNLLPLLKTPGLKIQDVALTVRDQVREVAQRVLHRQMPAYYDQLSGKFCFAGCFEGGASVVTKTNWAGKQSAQTEKQPAQPVKPAAPEPKAVAPIVDACSAPSPSISCLFKEH
jgi:uncharacterized caspase-like protein